MMAWKQSTKNIGLGNGKISTDTKDIMDGDE